MMVREIKDSQEGKYYRIILRVIIFFVVFQLSFLFQKMNFTWDDEGSLISAVGRKDDYDNIIENREYPYGKLVDIKQYKDLFKLKEIFCFGKIARDVTSFDTNPPLYTWLLHLWIMVTGGTARTGKTGSDLNFRNYNVFMARPEGVLNLVEIQKEISCKNRQDSSK